jgi:hypothetical protein
MSMTVISSLPPQECSSELAQMFPPPCCNMAADGPPWKVTASDFARGRFVPTQGHFHFSIFGGNAMTDGFLDLHGGRREGASQQKYVFNLSPWRFKNILNLYLDKKIQSDLCAQ